DPIVVTPNVNEFGFFGAAHGGLHVVVFFRPNVGTELQIDYKNPLALNRFTKRDSSVNARGSVYGHLFVISDADRMTLEKHKLIVTCNKREQYDFQTLPIGSVKQKLQLFKSSSGCLLALLDNAYCDYLVTEPVN